MREKASNYNPLCKGGCRLKSEGFLRELILREFPSNREYYDLCGLMKVRVDFFKCEVKISKLWLIFFIVLLVENY